MRASHANGLSDDEADFESPLTKSGQPCGQCKRLGKRCAWHAIKRQNRHSRTRARQDTFLLAFAKAATVTHAARAAGISRPTHYLWMAKDPEYAERFEQARAETTDELEFALRRVALSTDHLPSKVRALQILLRANCPERFGDKVSVEAPNSSPVVTGIEYVIVDPAAELPPR